VSKRHLFHLESRYQPLLGPIEFAWRMAIAFGAAILLTAVSLGLGMAGYMYFEHMEWIDAFANAAMILSGMGPLTPMQTFGGKLFAGFYALFSALVLILAAGLILAPIAHRVLHLFHLEDEEDKEK
jgi:hypothetical protein